MDGEGPEGADRGRGLGGASLGGVGLGGGRGGAGRSGDGLGGDAGMGGKPIFVVYGPGAMVGFDAGLGAGVLPGLGVLPPPGLLGLGLAGLGVVFGNGAAAALGIFFVRKKDMAGETRVVDERWKNRFLVSRGDNDMEKNMDFYLGMGAGLVARRARCNCPLRSDHISKELAQEASVSKERRKDSEERQLAKPKCKGKPSGVADPG